MRPRPASETTYGNTRTKDGAGRRIVIYNLHPHTTVTDIFNFFDKETIEGISIYDKQPPFAFVQFKRPQSYTEALLRSEETIRGSKIVIRNYTVLQSDDPKRDQRRSEHRRAFEQEHTQRPRRSPSPLRNPDRGQNRAIGSINHGWDCDRGYPRNSSQSRGYVLGREGDDRRSSVGYTPSPARIGYTHSPGLGSAHRSPRRLGSALGTARLGGLRNPARAGSRKSPARKNRTPSRDRSSHSNRHSGTNDSRHRSKSRNRSRSRERERSHSRSPARSLSIASEIYKRPKLEPKPSIPQSPLVPSQNIPFLLDDTPNHNQELMSRQIVALHNAQPRHAFAMPPAQFQHIPVTTFSENSESKQASFADAGNRDLPADVELVLKIIIQQGTASQLSMFQVDIVRRYMDVVAGRLATPHITQMPLPNSVPTGPQMRSITNGDAADDLVEVEDLQNIASKISKIPK